jgi:hypothetical protein
VARWRLHKDQFVDAQLGERADVTNFPSNEATSSRHNVRIAATYSAVRAARCSNGTPSAANSSLDHPTPTPRVSRPPLNRSRLAACLKSSAKTSSGCEGQRRLCRAHRQLPLPPWRPKFKEAASAGDSGDATGTTLRRNVVPASRF